MQDTSTPSFILERHRPDGQVDYYAPGDSFVTAGSARMLTRSEARHIDGALTDQGHRTRLIRVPDEAVTLRRQIARRQAELAAVLEGDTPIRMGA